MSQKVKKTEIGREKQKQQEQKKINNSKYNFMLLSCHIQVLEGIHSL